jgi:hypothetical protein
MIGRSTTFSSELESAGAALLGSAWGGVHAADTLPARPSQTLACRVVSTGGVHWLACAEEGGRRYFNDPLGTAGREQRAVLHQRYPDAQWADDDSEQAKSEKDCGVRSLVALCIAKDCGIQCYVQL